MSTIFAGLNTLKRLEIRPVGGPFVHGVPADRHEGLQRVIRARKREEDRVVSGAESRGDPLRRRGSNGLIAPYRDFHRQKSYSSSRLADPRPETRGDSRRGMGSGGLISASRVETFTGEVRARPRRKIVDRFTAGSEAAPSDRSRLGDSLFPPAFGGLSRRCRE